jgi:NTE family protein
MLELANEEGNRWGPGSPIAVLLSLPQLQASVANLGQAALADLEGRLEWCGISAGTTLFKQGDAAQDIFIVTAGRLGVLADIGIGEELVAQIQPGELVGEMALISDEARSASVVALRNTELIRMPTSVAQELISSNPQLMFYVLRLLASRVKSTTHRSSLKPATKAVAVIPIDAMPLGRDLADGLHNGFSSLSRRVALIDSTSSKLTTESISAIEEQHDLVVYFADDRCSPWSRRCSGQADRVIFVANAESTPDDEADQQINGVHQLRRPADLILLNRSDAGRPHGATAWLERFASHHIFHVRRGSAADYARVARLTTGRAVGVVFSGGGARGFAHIGAIRALYAAGIPIDLVGGTSIGAIAAGSTALGGDAEEIGRIFHHAFVQNHPMNDYTVPLIALARGKKMSRLLRHHCGDATIENLWKVFFCVSSNLSTGRIKIHQSGLLWRAIRASTAIPGIVPPCVESGEVLVDGAIMDNFPTSIMSSLARGSVIGIEVASDAPLVAKAGDIEGKSLLWLLRNRGNAVPGILEILMRSGTVGSEEQRIASRSAADLLIQPSLGSIGLLAFHSFEAAIELGYQATMEAIERLEKTPGANNVWPTRAT